MKLIFIEKVKYDTTLQNIYLGGSLKNLAIKQLNWQDTECFEKLRIFDGQPRWRRRSDFALHQQLNRGGFQVNSPENMFMKS